MIESVHQIMTHDVTPKDLPKFFWQHLLINFNSLSEALSIGLDDAILIIHLIMVEINKEPHKSIQFLKFFTALIIIIEFSLNNLETPEKRQNWENEFYRAYIQSVLKVSSY